MPPRQRARSTGAASAGKEGGAKGCQSQWLGLKGNPTKKLHLSRCCIKLTDKRYLLHFLEIFMVKSEMFHHETGSERSRCDITVGWVWLLINWSINLQIIFCIMMKCLVNKPSENSEICSKDARSTIIHLILIQNSWGGVSEISVYYRQSVHVLIR